MRPQLTEETKQEVIRLWLLGLPRDDIAHRAKVGSGSVNNIVDKWKEDLDKPDADALRELAKTIHASGLSPAQGILWLRPSTTSYHLSGPLLPPFCRLCK